MDTEIDIQIRSRASFIDRAELDAVLRHALQTERVGSAVLSVTVVDNEEIHRLNREHLGHDDPTDVISFPLEHSGQDGSAGAEGGGEFPAAGAHIEGEIVVSAEMAASVAGEMGRLPLEELKLYVVHGMLHLCGYDDLDPKPRQLMRQREAAILGQ